MILSLISLLLFSTTLYIVYQHFITRKKLTLISESIRKSLLGDYEILKIGIEETKNLLKEIQDQKIEERSKVYSLLENHLKKSDGFLGFWAAWEKGAFDSKDSTQGQMAPYVYRSEGKFARMTLENLNEEKFYTLPKQNKKLTIIDPFHFEIDGKNTLMTTIAIPIIEKGVVKGVVGVDIRLHNAKKNSS